LRGKGGNWGAYLRVGKGKKKRVEVSRKTRKTCPARVFKMLAGMFLLWGGKRKKNKRGKKFARGAEERGGERSGVFEYIVWSQGGGKKEFKHRNLGEKRGEM